MFDEFGNMRDAKTKSGLKNALNGLIKAIG